MRKVFKRKLKITTRFVSKKFNSFGINLFLCHKHINSSFALVVYKRRKFKTMKNEIITAKVLMVNYVISSLPFVPLQCMISEIKFSSIFLSVQGETRKSQLLIIFFCNL